MYAMQYDYMGISRHLSIRIALNSSVIFTFLPHHRDINFKHSICVACREYKYNAFYWQFDTFRMMDLQDITTGTSLFYHNQAIFLVGNEWCANENWNIKILINFGQKCYNLSKRSYKSFADNSLSWYHIWCCIFLRHLLFYLYQFSCMSRKTSVICECYDYIIIWSWNVKHTIFVVYPHGKAFFTHRSLTKS